MRPSQAQGERVLTGDHFVSGDVACAEGAHAAGCGFFAGYPITPSTEIAEHLARRLPEVGGAFVQMEDELGSMAAVLGAAWAGARAMTATSGPGFSLMQEGIGWGMFTEAPCVVVDVQRAGPSTGLPTQTSQADVGVDPFWWTPEDYVDRRCTEWERHRSSRKLAARCETDLAFRVLSGGELPDFRPLADFRKRHLAAMQALFVEVLRLCREAGLVKLGHLSLDGSKYQANASQHKAMSYGRIQEAEPKLEAEVKALLEQAERVDRAEDDEHGADRRGDELPEELRRREGRLGKIREAKARLEARARARERALARGGTSEQAAEAERAAEPGPREQSNFTDPDSRIMKTKSGWIQGYNAQVVVEEASGVILAQEVTGHRADSPRLAPMLDHLEAHLAALGVPEDERTPGQFSADAGYCSEPNLAEFQGRGIDAYVATGRERHHRGGVDPKGRPRNRYGQPCAPNSRPPRGAPSTPAARASPSRSTG